MSITLVTKSHEPPSRPKTLNPELHTLTDPVRPNSKILNPKPKLQSPETPRNSELGARTRAHSTTPRYPWQSLTLRKFLGLPWDFGFRVQGLGCGVYGSGLRV